MEGVELGLERRRWSNFGWPDATLKIMATIKEPFTGGMRECLRRTLRRLESWGGHDGEAEMELMRRDIRRVLGRKTKAERSDDDLYCKGCANLKSQCECWQPNAVR